MEKYSLNRFKKSNLKYKVIKTLHTCSCTKVNFDSAQICGIFLCQLIGQGIQAILQMGFDSFWVR